MVEGRRTTPFQSPAEAWRWALRAVEIRAGTASPRAAGTGSVLRPCDPDDVVAIFDALFRRQAITREHTRVLRRYPLEEPTLKADEALWNEAMAAAEPALRSKGIVA